MTKNINIFSPSSTLPEVPLFSLLQFLQHLLCVKYFYFFSLFLTFFQLFLYLLCWFWLVLDGKNKIKIEKQIFSNILNSNKTPQKHHNRNNFILKLTRIFLQTPFNPIPTTICFKQQIICCLTTAFNICSLIRQTLSNQQLCIESEFTN